MHLLVIEDERALCEAIVRSLRRLAYSVDYCYDGGGKRWSCWTQSATTWCCLI